MKAYLDLMRDVLENGYMTDDRTGVGTIALFGTMARFDCSGKKIPIPTTKKTAFNSIVGEFLWMFEGSTNVNRLRELTHGPGSAKRTIWDANYEAQGKALGYDNGSLGPVYGYQWRNFGGAGTFHQGTDQLFNAVETIKNNPIDRRILVSAWEPNSLSAMALPPCHYAFQFNVHNGILDIMFHMRSVDVFLGMPFDIVSYSLMLKVVASMTGLEPGEVIITGGNTHIYMNHVEQCKEQLSRTPVEGPELSWPGVPAGTTAEQFDFVKTLRASDFELVNYNPAPAIKAPMAV